MTRRLAIAFAAFAVGVAAGVAVLRPGHSGPSERERQAERAVEAASGADALRAACVLDHCGVVVRASDGARCQGWIVPIRGGRLGRPRRAALADC